MVIIYAKLFLILLTFGSREDDGLRYLRETGHAPRQSFLTDQINLQLS